MTWSRPDFGFHCVDGYKVGYHNLNYPDSGEENVSVSTISYTLSIQTNIISVTKYIMSMLIVGLRPCSNYNLSVQATTSFIGEFGDEALALGRTNDVGKS